MRYVVNSSNHVVAVSFGADMVFADCVCTEYTGSVPSGWNSLQEWYADEGEKLWRWKIVSGNLTLDSSAVAPEEGRWGVPDLQTKTVTPKATTQDVVPDEDFDGLALVKVMGDADLVPDNIKSGVNIFGVTGKHSGYKYVESTISNGFAATTRTFLGAGSDDNTPPKRIFGCYVNGAGGTPHYVQAFYLVRTSGGWGGYWHFGGTYLLSTDDIVTCSGGHIMISTPVSGFADGTYVLTALWE